MSKAAVQAIQVLAIVAVAAVLAVGVLGLLADGPELRRTPGATVTASPLGGR